MAEILMMPPWYQVKLMPQARKSASTILDVEVDEEQVSQTRKATVVHAPDPQHMQGIQPELLPAVGSVIWIPEFTGISDPYEVPEDAEVRIDTTDMTPEESANRIILHLERLGYISGRTRTTSR